MKCGLRCGTPPKACGCDDSRAPREAPGKWWATALAGSVRTSRVLTVPTMCPPSPCVSVGISTGATSAGSDSPGTGTAKWSSVLEWVVRLWHLGIDLRFFVRTPGAWFGRLVPCRRGRAFDAVSFVQSRAIRWLNTSASQQPLKTVGGLLVPAAHRRQHVQGDLRERRTVQEYLRDLGAGGDESPEVVRRAQPGRD